jgi:hypothetical protein
VSEFVEFPKMARLSRECVITEKIDGTNAQVFIEQDLGAAPDAAICPPLTAEPIDGFVIRAGSRNRWITPAADNFGFARWVQEHAAELVAGLGPGRHFGEWWGAGIQRRYGLGATNEKRFSLFNTARWGQTPETIVAPKCCHVVPVLYRGVFTTEAVEECIERLRRDGSAAAPGFMQPEGVVVFHTAAGVGFKKTLEKDEQPKSKEAAA